MKNKLILVLIAMSFGTAITTAQTYVSQNITKLSTWFDPAVVPEPSYGIKYNGMWGWHDGAGNEYAIVGSTAGTYFVNVTNPTAPVQCDFVAGRRTNCIWHEVKTYQNYCYIVSDDASPNSLIIVDMSYLPDSVHVVYDENTLFERAHTIWVDGSHLYCASVNGGSVVNSGMAVFDISNPVAPVLIRKIEDDYPGLFSYAHDMYVRNDTVFASCGYDGLYIFKLDANNHFVSLGLLDNYFNQGYNHSSALSRDGHTLYFCEEVPDGHPVRSVDVTDLSNINILTTFVSQVGATPHNPFIIGDFLFIAYYQDGLQVYNISNPLLPVKVGFFDTYWQNDASGTFQSPAYKGAWGAYPWLPSGNMIVSDMQNGLFVLDVSVVTGIKNNLATNNVLLYPNPANNNFLTINSTTKYSSDFRYEIMNANGQLLQQDKLTDSQIEIRNLSAGVYTLRLIDNNIISVQKFVRSK